MTFSNELQNSHQYWKGNIFEQISKIFYEVYNMSLVSTRGLKCLHAMEH